MAADDDSNVIPLLRKYQRGTDFEQEIAIFWEAHFHARGVSITDPTARKALQATADAMDSIVRGGHTTGVITEEQASNLRWWIASISYAIREFGE